MPHCIVSFNIMRQKKLWKEGGDKVLRAWAVFVLSHQTFSSIMTGTWAYSDQKNLAVKFTNVKQNGGYTKENFKSLLDWLSTCKGKFLLTTYPSDILTEYAASNGWKMISNVMHLSASNKPGAIKTEVFTMNYNPPTQGVLFS